jgi:hypothetical protein
MMLSLSCGRKASNLQANSEDQVDPEERGTMESTLLTITASLVLAGLTALFAYFRTRSRISLDLSAEYDKDLRTSRLQVYQELWKLLEPLARYSRPGPVTYQVVKDMAEKMRIWYFQQGGIFLTKGSYDPYFTLKKSLQDIIDDTPCIACKDAEIDKERLATLLIEGNLLRSSLTEDIGSRNESFLLRKRK